MPWSLQNEPKRVAKGSWGQAGHLSLAEGSTELGAPLGCMGLFFFGSTEVLNSGPPLESHSQPLLH
jgi:hypothetical protein